LGVARLIHTSSTTAQREKELQNERTKHTIATMIRSLVSAALQLPTRRSAAFHHRWPAAVAPATAAASASGRALLSTTSAGSSSTPHSNYPSYGVVPKSDFGPYAEYSVIHTDRSLNLMSDPFGRVMRDLNELMKYTYQADRVAIIPGYDLRLRVLFVSLSVCAFPGPLDESARVCMRVSCLCARIPDRKPDQPTNENNDSCCWCCLMVYFQY
jgi:hypothetical protein